MQGFDRPQYTNVADAVPRSAAARCPTRTRRVSTAARSTVPAAWAGQRIVLHVAGAESVLYVHVDGAPVGDGQGLAPAPRVRPHRTSSSRAEPFELALTVVRWSDATYLEDQDHWYHAGLHRSVLRLRDAAGATSPTCTRPPTTTRPPATAGCTCASWTSASTGTGPTGGRVRVASAAGRPPTRRSTSSTRPNWLAELAGLRGARRRGLSSTVPDVAPWSAEDPEPPRPHRHPARRRRRRGRRSSLDVGLPARRGGRPRAARQRPAGARSRASTATTTIRDGGKAVTRGVDRGRPRADEAARHQRGAHLALPERRVPLRRVRPARHLRGRRGQHRGARVPAQPHQGSACGRPRSSSASRGWRSATRTTRRSSCGRSATRAAARPLHARRGRVAARVGPVASGALRGRHRRATSSPAAGTPDIAASSAHGDAGDRRHRADVPGGRRDRRLGDALAPTGR